MKKDRKISKTEKSTTIEEFQRNARDVVRITLDRYNGMNLIQVRIWTMGLKGELVPTLKGISLRVEHLPKLDQGIRKARRRAKRRGLLQTDREK